MVVDDGQDTGPGAEGVDLTEDGELHTLVPGLVSPLDYAGPAPNDGPGRVYLGYSPAEARVQDYVEAAYSFQIL